MTITCATDYVNAIRSAMPANCASQHMQVEGLDVELRALDPASIAWVLRYMQPLSLAPAQEVRARYTVNFMYSDDLMLDAIEHLNDIDLVQVRRHGRDRFVRRARPAPDAVAYCDPDEGILWLSDLASDSIYVVVSSRTKHPAIVFASLVREVVTRYLAEQGWTLFHAGAVATPRGALMVVGNAGAGKTSLLLALLCGGASFIANEVLFVRDGEQGLEVLGYPMAIAVGLGTALQFAPLAERIDSPGALEYPRNRLKLEQVIATPRSEWPGLDDKLQLLPLELSRILGAPAPTAGGALCGLVVPMVSRQAGDEAVAQALSQAEARAIVAHNHLGLSQNSSHKPWLALSFSDGPSDGQDRLFDRLAALSPQRFRFALSLETPDETDTYLAALLGAIASRP